MKEKCHENCEVQLEYKKSIYQEISKINTEYQKESTKKILKFIKNIEKRSTRNIRKIRKSATRLVFPARSKTRALLCLHSMSSKPLSA